VTDRNGVRLLVCPDDGPLVAGEAEALELVAAALPEAVDVVVVPAGRLDPDFFRLRTGIAGMVVQKLLNYRLRLVVLGDISGQLTASPTLRDWVAEANRGRDIWFTPDLSTLDERLAGAA
jgi:Domain of unknown function (DUF4180)